MINGMVYNGYFRNIPALPVYNVNNTQNNCYAVSPELREEVYKAVDNMKVCMKNYKAEKLILNAKNEVEDPANPELAKNINVVGKAFPEFLATINRRDVHGSTLVVHLLNAFKALELDPYYKQLTPEEQRIADFAVLFHDIAKKENSHDPEHPANSALMAESMMKRFGWNDNDAAKVGKIIRFHHWVGELNTCEKNINETVNDFETLSEFKIGILVGKSDITAGADPKRIKEFNSKYIGDGIITKIEQRLISRANMPNQRYYYNINYNKQFAVRS